MASLSKDKNGSKRIQWADASGKRHTIRLGKINVKAGEAFLARLERLIASKLTGTPIDGQTAQWLAELPDGLYGKLVGQGLAEVRNATEAHTLGAMLDEYFQTMSVKDTTRVRYAQTKRLLLDYFKADRTLDSITTRDGDKWRAWLVGKEYAEAKIGRDVCGARMFFRQAVRWEMIPSNPFEGVKAGPRTSTRKKDFITPEQTRKLINAAPDPDWRCIIALARYGGLRCPSEVLGVRWADVDWAQNRLRVRSPKTERHAGKGERLVPLFPELRAELMDAFELAPEGAEYVVHHHRDRTANLRTHMRRIIDRAGLKDWPNLFNALRASRATELMNQYPAAYCTEWMGHSQAIAEAHYYMVRDEDYDRAASTPIETPRPTEGVSECVSLVSQNASQHEAAPNGNNEPNGAQIEKGSAFMLTPSECCGSLQSEPMGIRGLEPRTPAFSMPCSTN